MIEHEAGQWLDDLIRDAKHQHAPQKLREDAGVVRQYLGVRAGEPLTCEHYTRFASRFEQYVALNTAPTAAMASIFAEFRKWLVTVFQTADQSGWSISPEIRSWFEQSVLVASSERIVIVPDKQSEAPSAKLLQTSPAARPVQAISATSPVSPNVGQMIDEGIVRDLTKLWGGRLPTWTEYKAARHAGRVKTNKGVAQRAVNQRGVPAYYRIMFGAVTPWGMFLVPIAGVFSYFFSYSNGWFAVAALAGGIFCYKLTFAGACYGVLEGAEADEVLYQRLITSGAFLFAPPSIQSGGKA
ncbi:MAG: hypothetical protein ACREQO_06540 [Candidatus Binatia bacterium]